MGLSRRRMDKLIRARRGHSGVAAKGRRAARARAWGGRCAQGAGVADARTRLRAARPTERYRLALVHQRECPACRAYVASLRGLAAVLPPLSLPARRRRRRRRRGRRRARRAARAGLAGVAARSPRLPPAATSALGSRAPGLRRAWSGSHVHLAAARWWFPDRRRARVHPARVRQHRPAAWPRPRADAVAATAPVRPSGAAARPRAGTVRAAREFGVESISAPAAGRARAAAAGERRPAGVACPPGSATPACSSGRSDRAAHEFGVEAAASTAARRRGPTCETSRGHGAAHASGGGRPRRSGVDFLSGCPASGRGRGDRGGWHWTEAAEAARPPPCMSRTRSRRRVSSYCVGTCPSARWLCSGSTSRFTPR